MFSLFVYLSFCCLFVFCLFVVVLWGGVWGRSARVGNVAVGLFGGGDRPGVGNTAVGLFVGGDPPEVGNTTVGLFVGGDRPGPT